MAVAFDAAAEGTTSGQASTDSGSITVGSGENRAIFVITAVDSGSGVSTLTAAGLSVAGGSLVLAGTMADNGGRRISIYRGVNPASGSTTASVGWSNTDSTRQGIGVVTFSGVDQTTPSADYGSEATTGSTPSISVSNVTADDMVIDGLFHVSLTGPGANQTERWNASTFAAGSTQAGADGGAMTWTTGESIAYAYAACRVVSAGAAASAVPVIRNQMRNQGLA